MIRNFWVRNFLSIDDRQQLSFVAKGPASELVVEVADHVFLYKLGILYGANASGKSNMLLAMNEIFRLMTRPKFKVDKRISGYIPFALHRGDPTEMHVSFYAEGIRYDYEVAFDGSHILHETLNYYPKGAKSLFYERRFVADDVQADIKFGPSLKIQARTQERIRENTLNNHSVLASCAKTAFKEDIGPLSRLHRWVMACCHEVDGDGEKEKGIVEILKDAYADSKRRKFFYQMLQKADLNILEYRPVVEDRVISPEMRRQIEQEDLPEKVKEALLSPTVDSVTFVNATAQGNFDIPIRWQSKGTLKYIRILNVLYDLVTGLHVYFLDELGEDLHYDLLFYYLSVFLYNSTQSQLVISSQETTLLSQELINENRGAVWFVEKRKESASSEYARGDSFGLHKNLSLYNSYRIGKLGSKPELGSIFIGLED